MTHQEAQAQLDSLKNYTPYQMAGIYDSQTLLAWYGMARIEQDLDAKMLIKQAIDAKIDRIVMCTYAS